MTDHAHIHDPSDCGGDAAPYVLGALTREEAEAFRSHLSTCAVCRDEVAALKMAADALPLAAPQLPAPRRLRRRVVSAVHEQPRKVAGVARRSAPRQRVVWPAAALGGAVALAAVVAVFVLARGGSSGVRVVRASVSAPSASALVRVSGGHAELIVRAMPRPPGGKIYEIWLKRDGRSPSPTDALFSVTSTGDGVVAVPGDLDGVREVLVTPEPLGGSSAPTHSPVIIARLS